MATPEDTSGSAPARANEIATTTNTPVTFRPDELEHLREALILGGSSPKDGPAVARVIDWNKPEPMSPFDIETNGTLVGHALAGTFVGAQDPHSEFWPDVPEGAIDTGIARAMLEEECDSGAMHLLLMRQATHSTMLAREVCLVVSALQERASLEDMSDMLRSVMANVFRGGFLVGCDAMRLDMLNQLARTAGEHPEQTETIAKSLDLQVIPEAQRAGAIAPLLDEERVGHD